MFRAWWEKSRIAGFADVLSEDESQRDYEKPVGDPGTEFPKPVMTCFTRSRWNLKPRANF